MADIELIKFGDPLKGIDNGLIEGNIIIAAEVTSETKSRAPVDDGPLRNGYMYATPKETGGFNDSPGSPAEEEITVVPKKGEAYVGNAVPHSIYQEFGTRNMAPQPHFRPAIAVVVKGETTKSVLAKIQFEEMLGPLKEGEKRVRF